MTFDFNLLSSFFASLRPPTSVGLPVHTRQTSLTFRSRERRVYTRPKGQVLYGNGFRLSPGAGRRLKSFLALLSHLPFPKAPERQRPRSVFETFKTSASE